MSVWVDLWSSELNINCPHWSSVCRGCSENIQFGFCRRCWCTHPSLRQNTKQHIWWIFFLNLYVKSKAAVYWIMVIQFKTLLFWLLGSHQMFESCLAHTCSNPRPQTHSCRELRLPTRPLHWDVLVFASLDHCCQQEWATLSRCGGRHYRLQFPNSHQDSHWKINECLRSLLAACLAIKGLDQWTRDDFKGHWD